jgi:hypothetical protein
LLSDNSNAHLGRAKKASLSDERNVRQNKLCKWAARVILDAA